jgi:hypothetical protein
MTEVPPLVESTPAIRNPAADPEVQPKERLQFLGLVGGHYLLAAAGIIAVYSQARHSTNGAHDVVFWFAYCIAIVVTLAAGCFRYTTQRAQLLLLTIFGIFTFLPKFLMSVNGPAYFDEYGHLRQVNDIVSTGHLMPENTFLPIVKYYPGLETLTAGVHYATGLSTWHSGQVVVLLAHCASLVVVYQLARTVGLSNTVSFLAALIFSLNPSFLFFDSQFSYESLGMPLAFATLLCVMRARLAPTPAAAKLWTGFGIAGALACITTHHVSAVVMSACCLIAARFVHPRVGAKVARSWAVKGAWTITAVAVVGTVFWIAIVASPTRAYISPHIEQGVSQVFDLFGSSTSSSGGAAGGRSLFAGPNPAPAYEQLAAFAAPVIVGLAVLIGFLALWPRARRAIALRQNAVFIALSVAYFVSLPLTLTSAGSEAAHRSWVFGYVGLSILAAAALSAGFASVVPRLRARGRLIALVLGSLTLVLVAMGNVAVGVNLYYRFPGPATFGVDTRFTTPELTQLTKWSRTHLPAGSHIVTDRFTGQELTAYTTFDVPKPHENPVYALYREGFQPSPIVVRTLKAGNFRYFILDKRIATQVPQQRLWPGYQGLQSVNAVNLARLAHSTVATGIYQNAYYVVYLLRV